MADDPTEGLTSPDFILYDPPWFLVYASGGGRVDADTVVRQDEETPEFGRVSVVHMFTDSDLAKRAAETLKELGVDALPKRLARVDDYYPLAVALSRIGATHVALDVQLGRITATRIATAPIADAIESFRRFRRE